MDSNEFVEGIQILELSARDNAGNISSIQMKLAVDNHSEETFNVKPLLGTDSINPSVHFEWLDVLDKEGPDSSGIFQYELEIFQTN